MGNGVLRDSRNHLAQVGESYFEQMRFALTVGLLACGAGLACILHALIPAVCEQSCSRTIGHLQALFADRRQLPFVVEQCSGVSTFLVLMILSSAVAGMFILGRPELWLGAVIGALAYSIPAAFLIQNRTLDPLPAE